MWVRLLLSAFWGAAGMILTVVGVALGRLVQKSAGRCCTARSARGPSPIFSTCSPACSSCCRGRGGQRPEVVVEEEGVAEKGAAVEGMVQGERGGRQQQKPRPSPPQQKPRPQRN